jgi:hypothetical protein
MIFTAPGTKRLGGAKLELIRSRQLARCGKKLLP